MSGVGQEGVRGSGIISRGLCALRCCINICMYELPARIKIRWVSFLNVSIISNPDKVTLITLIR